MSTKTVVIASLAILTVGTILIIIYLSLSVLKEEIVTEVKKQEKYGTLSDAKVKLSQMKMEKLKSSINQYVLMHSQLPKKLEFLIDCKQTPNLKDCTPIADAEDLTDAWGKSFIYSNDKGSNVLMSYGKDGIENTNDDIKLLFYIPE